MSCDVMGPNRTHKLAAQSISKVINICSAHSQGKKSLVLEIDRGPETSKYYIWRFLAIIAYIICEQHLLLNIDNNNNNNSRGSRASSGLSWGRRRESSCQDPPSSSTGRCLPPSSPTLQRCFTPQEVKVGACVKILAD